MKHKRRCGRCNPSIHGRCSYQPLPGSSNTFSSSSLSRSPSPKSEPGSSCPQQPWPPTALADASLGTTSRLSSQVLLAEGGQDTSSSSSQPAGADALRFSDDVRQLTCPTFDSELCGLPGDHDAADQQVLSAPSAAVFPSSPPPLERFPSPTVDLPEPVPMARPVFQWGTVSGEEFVRVVDSVYDEVVHWRRNLFKVPSGKEGKAFVSELARLFRSYAEATALEQVALKAAMVMPHLLLQKPDPNSKAKDHCAHLSRRLRAWEQGDLLGLVQEGRVLQRHLGARAAKAMDGDHTASLFSKLMFQGKTRAAIRLLSEQGRGSVLPLHQPVDPSDANSETVLDALKAKHPMPGPITSDALAHCAGTPPSHHSIIFDKITGESIRQATLRCSGSAGPSGLDAAAWQRLTTSFRGSSSELCTAIALFARRICTQHVSFPGLAAFTACRLIALDKCPGVRPIGIGEVVRRIVGKAVLSVVGPDVQRAAGTIQLCAGQEGGPEAAIHATRLAFGDSCTEGVLLVDAKNAFNQLNRRVALLNVARLCPSVATVLINTYRGDTFLFVSGTVLFSREGTTQGDPLAMIFYALATLPLIEACHTTRLSGEVWFADDATGSGPLTALREWWDKLLTTGPLFGYLPNGPKTWLVVKPDLLLSATEIFHGTGVNVTAQGRRHLGAALGTRTFVEEYVLKQVDEWVAQLHRLSAIAECHPHAAYSAFVHGIRSRWLYLARTTPDISDLFTPLETALRTQFIPALTGRDAPSELERTLLALPARLGGLGIVNPVEAATDEHQSSLRLTSSLVLLQLQQRQAIDLDTAALPDQQSRGALRSEKQKRLKNAAAALLPQLPLPLQHAMTLASEKGASSWLTALPLASMGLTLHKGAFRDALCLRYGWQPALMSSTCDCGASLSTAHALSCPTGGFPTMRHNEIRDLLADLMTDVAHDVSVEPPLQPVTGEVFSSRATTTDDGARLDLAASGVWGGRFERAFFDVRVINPLARSNQSLPPASCYRRHEADKRRKYLQRVVEVEHASFVPFVVSATGGLGPSATATLQRIAQLSADATDQPYSRVMGWMRCRMAFALIRSAIMCLRGARSARHRPVLAGRVPADLAIAEARVDITT